MKRFWRKGIILGLILVVLTPTALFAQESQLLDDLNASITDKKSSLDIIESRIDQVQRQLDALRQKSQSLQNETLLIENRIEKVRLDIEASELRISALTDEIQVLDLKLDDLERQQFQEKQQLASVLREINVSDQQSQTHLIFGTSTFSEFFERVQFYRELNKRLKGSIERTANLKEEAGEKRRSQEEKLASIEEIVKELTAQEHQLEHQEEAKLVLLRETNNSEAEFAALVQELQQEQAFIRSQIRSLQDDIDRRLREQDSGGATDRSELAFSWPVNRASAVITATFNDPTYPFRHLWEHSGLDLAAPTGTPILAPAPGYVAWTRQGRLYGNHMMVIHADGVATLYAHLSSFEVGPDQFVERGQIIGRMGSTGFSTGPHLHFEVREDGIPVNPINYLIK